jgi:hypothetical protein
MSRRRRLLCSLPLIALAFAVINGAQPAVGAPVQPDAESTLIDVNESPEQSAALLATDSMNEPQSWTILWDDLAVKEGDAPVVSGGGSSTNESPRTPPFASQAPPIIAAPLPPAIVSGVIGLVGVYMYKRRNRFVNR